MTEKVDYTKLKAFVEASLTNVKHPVFAMGMAKSEALQHYALNVATLAAVEAEQWFEDYPHYTAKLAEVMRLCEEDEATPAVDYAAKVAELENTVADLTAKLAAVPAVTPAETPEA